MATTKKKTGRKKKTAKKEATKEQIASLRKARAVRRTRRRNINAPTDAQAAREIENEVYDGLPDAFFEVTEPKVPEIFKKLFDASDIQPHEAFFMGVLGAKAMNALNETELDLLSRILEPLFDKLHIDSP